jgi:probable HAF family extracellular repeat protein
VLEGAIGADARGISKNGQFVCGFSRFGNGSQWFAFVHNNGRGQNLGTLPISGHDRSIAYAVNDDGIAVGRSAFPNESGVAFVWRNGVMKALNDLVPPGHNLNIDLVKSINNAGQIAGSAHVLSPQGGVTPEQVAIRLTPIPSPPGDCDCNGVVNIDDLLAVINQWGPAIPTTTADFDNNGTVGVEDLMEVIRLWTR